MISGTKKHAFKDHVRVYPKFGPKWPKSLTKTKGIEIKCGTMYCSDLH